MSTETDHSVLMSQVMKEDKMDRDEIAVCLHAAMIWAVVCEPLTHDVCLSADTREITMMLVSTPYMVALHWVGHEYLHTCIFNHAPFNRLETP